MTDFKKTVSFLLVTAMLAASFTSCSESEVNEESTADTSSSSVSKSTSEETAEEEIPVDSLEAVVKNLPNADYEGYTFTSYNTNWINETLFMRQSPDDELTGEPINDALWERDRAVEDKYNITLDYVVFAPGASLYNEAEKGILSGDDSIGLIYGNMAGESPSFLKNKLTIDMNTIPAIDLTQPYWSQHNKDIEIAGKLMFATGDITCRYAGAPYLMLFNKQLIVDHGYQYPYDDVRAGTWTFDKLSSMVEETYQDTGKATNDDFYGFIFEINKGYAFYNSFGYKAVDLDENNEPVLNVASENHINAIQKITQFAINPNNYITTYAYEETEMFKRNQSIFVDQTACNLSLLTDMEADFGILPLPKENEEQADYYSFCNNGCAIGVQIPKTVQNLDRTGMIVNALAAASRVSSMKAQYEVTLQYRQTRDEDSVEMLKLASEAARYDYTVVYGWGNLMGTINNCIQTDSPIASQLKGVQKVVSGSAKRTVRAIVED